MQGHLCFYVFVLKVLYLLLQHKNTVAVNVETLNGKIDVQPVFDPFLRSVGNMGDCQPGDCHFLTNLNVRANCALTLCSDLLYWDNSVKPVSSGRRIGQLPFIPGTVLVYGTYQCTLLLGYGL
jgi:hypothetical protein